MQVTIYRLGEYKIIESDTGELRWEAHFGLGTLQEGMCFRKGVILFIGPAENERLGFLKREFFDHIQQFPEWLKTKYYCRGLEVYHCKTGKKVTKVEMRLWMLDRGIDDGGRILTEIRGKLSNNIFPGGETEHVSFRLQKYEIIKKPNDQVAWKTYAGPNIGKGGNCTILEDILFIGSWQNEQFNLIKRQFLANLKLLPKWDQTRYFCPRLSLHDCKTINRVHEEKKKWMRKRTAACTNGVGKRYKNNIEFKLKKSDLWENRPMFFGHWVRKCITYATTLILLMNSCFLAYSIRCWEELKGRWHFQKGKDSFS